MIHFIKKDSFMIHNDSFVIHFQKMIHDDSFRIHDSNHDMQKMVNRFESDSNHDS